MDLDSQELETIYVCIEKENIEYLILQVKDKKCNLDEYIFELIERSIASRQ